MSVKQIAPDSGLQQLLYEGFEVEVRHQHLIVHGIPYVTAQQKVEFGTLVCKYIENAGSILTPDSPGDNHQVWWIGCFPCNADGNFLTGLLENTQAQHITLFEEYVAQFQFSNKPDIWATNFPDHYEKVSHYVTVIQSQAKVIDTDIDARTWRIIESHKEDSVFRYADTASVRAEIVATSARLKLKKVAIVGMGGTGSYILDQVAKTPVCEIHLFDGDDFKQHNAFRAPGAAAIATLKKRMKKVDYFLQGYDAMRSGIITHPYYLNEHNVAELAGNDFVFVSVDKGPARKVVCEYLIAQDIPFVDVGMDVVMNPETLELDGTCRLTSATSYFNKHTAQYLPVDEDESDALYRQNIQVADLNALNAQLAVIKWKQLFGFYEDRFRSHHSCYTVATQSLTRGEISRKEI